MLKGSVLFDHGSEGRFDVSGVSTFFDSYRIAIAIKCRSRDRLMLRFVVFRLFRLVHRGSDPAYLESRGMIFAGHLF